MKIAIIGYSGSGKSTLAKYLAKHYDISLLHLDTLQFVPNWEMSDRSWMQEQVKFFLEAKESWVIDGNYSSCCYEERIEHADQIIFLNFSRWNCLLRAAKRYSKNRGKVRDSMAQGCPEKFDWEFIRWILWDGRSSVHKEQYKQICLDYTQKSTIIHNQRELDQFLNQK